MFSVSSGCRYDVQRQGLHGASAIVIVSKNVRWVQKTGIRVQNKNRSQRATGLRSTRRFSVRRALTPHRIRSATSPAAPTAMERTRWSCGTVHSLAPVRVPPFGPCGAPRPRRSGRSTQPARPNRELSKLSFASCFSFFQGAWLRGKWPPVCQRLVALDGDGSCRLIRPRPSRSGEQIYWSKIFWTKYLAGEQAQPLSRSQICFMDFFWPIRFNGPNRRIAREPDEETCICNSPDRIAGLGANQIAAQERDGACRSLCAHWPDRRRQAGLFDEVRKFAGPAATASAG